MEKVLLKLLDLIERSVVVQGTVTLGFAAAVIYLSVSGRAIPDQLGYALATILGFWFGTKVQNDLTRARKTG